MKKYNYEENILVVSRSRTSTPHFNLFYLPKFIKHRRSHIKNSKFHYFSVSDYYNWNNWRRIQTTGIGDLKENNNILLFERRYSHSSQNQFSSFYKTHKNKSEIPLTTEDDSCEKYFYILKGKKK